MIQTIGRKNDDYQPYRKSNDWILYFIDKVLSENGTEENTGIVPV
jgi:hypothetical protein